MSNFVMTSIRNINEAINNNKLVVFIGAGVSKNSGLPSWETLIRNLAKDLDLEDEYNNSLEDNMKIPQIYYNERGKNEYYQRINDFFSDELLPNEIHDKIFKLDPEHIITTNFDNLLEKKIDNDGLFYHIIKENKDLSYNLYEKSVIKMHGDLNKRNIVLKEEDYLSYSNDFRLIENFIKSLFSTHLILFIGYSAKDYDFKIIYQWVKNILNDDFQPAYLLSLDDYNEMQFKYFKNKGINILNYSKIEDKINNNIKSIQKEKLSFENTKGLKLYKFLEFIINYDQIEVSDNINKIYKKLSLFNNLGHIRTQDIYNSFKELNIFGRKTYGKNGYQLEIRNEDLFGKFQKHIKNNVKIEKKYGEKLDHIIETFIKADIFEIIYRGKEDEKKLSLVKFKSSENNELETYLHNFDFNNLNKYLFYFGFEDEIEGNEYKFLKKAYYLYKTEQYIEAYNLLKKVSLTSFKNKNYVIYMFSEFNKTKLLPLLKNEKIKINDDEIKNKINNITQEIEKINMEKLFAKIPKSKQKLLNFLRKIFNFKFVYKQISDINKYLDKIKEQKEKIEGGGFSYTRDLQDLYYNTLNMLNYIEGNCLMIDHFREVESFYTNFIKGVFTSYSINEDNLNEDLYPDFPVQKISNIDYWILYSAITKVKFNELSKIMNKLEIDRVNVEPEVKEKILIGFKNLVNTISKKNDIQELELRMNRGLVEYLNNFLVIISRLNLGKEEINDIIRSIKKLLEMKLNIKFLKNLTRFFNKFMNLNKDVIEAQQINEILEVVINYYSYNHNINEDNIVALDKYHLIMVLTHHIRSYNNCVFDNEHLFKRIQNDSETYLKNNEYRIIKVFIKEIFIPLYGISNKVICNQIYEFITKIFEDIRGVSHKKNINDIIEIYFQIFNSNILQQEEYDVQKYLNLIGKVIEENKERDFLTGDPIEICLYQLAKLIKEEKIDINKFQDLLSKFKYYSDYLYFIIDRENFDYSKFELNWFKTFNESEISEMLENENLREVVIEKVKKKLLDTKKFESYSYVFDLIMN